MPKDILFIRFSASIWLLDNCSVERWKGHLLPHELFSTEVRMHFDFFFFFPPFIGMFASKREGFRPERIKYQLAVATRLDFIAFNCENNS